MTYICARHRASSAKRLKTANRKKKSAKGVVEFAAMSILRIDTDSAFRGIVALIQGFRLTDDGERLVCAVCVTGARQRRSD